LAAYGEFPEDFWAYLGHKAHRRLKNPEQKIFKPENILGKIIFVWENIVKFL
jgi:hypothetical protein